MPEALQPVVEFLTSPRLLVVVLLLLPGVYVHYRGQVRHKVSRQLTDHSTFTAPYNVLMYLFSQVPRDPVIPVERFPELATLREHWQEIRDEAMQLDEEGHVKASERYDDLGFNSFFRRGWKRFYLKWYDDFLPSARERCPRTVELLASIPTINAAMFTSLAPHSKLVTHRDPFAGSLRYHLGLATPNSEQCYITIDGTSYAWSDGGELVFDETYIHTAVNDTDDLRIILFCDVTRPIWFPPVRWLNQWVIRHIVKASATRNEEGDKVGVLNKAFGGVYRLRLVAKRVKAWNKPVYYVLKFVLLGGVLALFLLA